MSAAIKKSSKQDLTITLYSRFVYIVVYRGPLGGSSPSETDIPQSIGAHSEDSAWYIAAKYTWQEYESNIAGKSFTIGDGQTTTVSGEVYTNVEVTPGYTYSIYIRIIASGDNEVSRMLSCSVVLNWIIKCLGL